MSNSVYHINKGINKPIEFKGLKAQYIWYLGGAVIGLLVLFAVMYIAGLPPIICVIIIGAAGGLSVMKVYAMSNKYGEHGMMKEMAKRLTPKVIKIRSRMLFINLGDQE